jgi:hypothetical protein
VSATHQTGLLFIEGQRVGDVQIAGWKGAWGMGTFAADLAFQNFRALFEEWSRLMHADAGPISDEAAARLRDLEYHMYALRCRIWLVESRQWRRILILNIDGPAIEWKEGWAIDEAESFESPDVSAVATGTSTVL